MWSAVSGSVDHFPGVGGGCPLFVFGGATGRVVVRCGFFFWGKVEFWASENGKNGQIWAKTAEFGQKRPEFAKCSTVPASVPRNNSGTVGGTVEQWAEQWAGR